MSKFFAALGGLLLLAPAAHATLNISSGATKNVTCASNTCSATAKNAVLNAGELSAMLASNDVTVVANGDAQTIGISTSFSWASAHLLTLSAHHDVVIKVPVAVEGLGGVHVMTRVGTGDEDGDLKFLPGGRIDFWDTGASFNLNGITYALVNDAASVGSAYVSDANANVALAKDYDAGPDGAYQDAVVTVVAKGNFEGLGHAISNLTVIGRRASRLVGFFSQNWGNIRDVTLSNAQVTSNAHIDRSHSAYAGLLAGTSSGTMTGVHTSGSVSALDRSYAGGLAGYGPAVLRSDSSAAVSCAKQCHAGGLVGYAGSYLLSHASGPVTVGPHGVAGGIVSVLGNGGAGGIVQSYATGDVTINGDGGDLGGLVGETLQNSSITDSYALGAVHGTDNAQLGGLLGSVFANVVRNTYSTGAVSGSTTPGRFIPGIGGWVGFAEAIDRPNFTHDYWDVDTSLQTVGCGEARQGGCPKPTGLSDAQLKAQLPAGFNPSIWGQSPSINNGYPYLLANPPE